MESGFITVNGMRLNYGEGAANGPTRRVVAEIRGFFNALER